MSGYAMTGVEAVSLELFARLPVEEARARCGPLEPELEAGEGFASVLFFQMRGLSLWGLPRVDYGEALWRVKVRHGGGAAWLAIACDIDRALPRLFAARLVRYPTRAAAITFEQQGEQQLTVKVSPGLEARLTPTGEHGVSAALPLLVAPGGRLMRVPFGARTGRGPFDCRVELAADALLRRTLGEKARVSSALLQWDRPHECGLASAEP